MENIGFKSTISPKNFTLLIVDDEDDLREVLCFQFQREGFKVLEANSGKAAFEIVKSQKVDLIITDIQMPGGNGVELLEKVRERNDETPIILFLTGFANLSVEVAFQKGAEAVFAKPFDQKVLLNAVLQALEPKDDRWRARLWRGDTALPVELTFPGLDSSRMGQVLNLSRGGAFVTYDKASPKVGDKIGFKIHFKEGSIVVIEGSGIVKWVRPGDKGEYPTGCGIEFVDLRDDTKSKVIELINFLKTKQYIPKT